MPYALGARNSSQTSSHFMPPDNSLLHRFNAHFYTATANTPAQILEAQRVRYQVYCVENPLEQPNPEEIETDRFDSHSVHSLLVCRAATKPLGTARLILPLPGETEHSFPMQGVLGAPAARDFRKLPLHSAAEVSRFSISRQFRRTAEGSDEAQADFISVSGPLMRLGLIQSL